MASRSAPCTPQTWAEWREWGHESQGRRHKKPQSSTRRSEARRAPTIAELKRQTAQLKPDETAAREDDLRLLVLADHPQHHHLLRSDLTSGDLASDDEGDLADYADARHRIAIRQIVITQLWHNEPKRTWREAKKMLAAGHSREEAIIALAQPAKQVAEAALSLDLGLLGRLREVHHALQATFRWTDSHLHLFTAGARKISDPTQFDGGERESGVKLSHVLSHKDDTLDYEYDFGDSWKHRLKVEDIFTDHDRWVRCVGGRQSAPPEDYGGIYRFNGLTEALANPTHPMHDDAASILFDALSGFDQDSVNSPLRKVPVS